MFVLRGKRGLEPEQARENENFAGSGDRCGGTGPDRPQKRCIGGGEALEFASDSAAEWTATGRRVRWRSRPGGLRGGRPMRRASRSFQCRAQPGRMQAGCNRDSGAAIVSWSGCRHRGAEDKWITISNQDPFDRVDGDLAAGAMVGIIEIAAGWNGAGLDEPVCRSRSGPPASHRPRQDPHPLRGSPSERRTLDCLSLTGE